MNISKTQSTESDKKLKSGDETQLLVIKKQIGWTVKVEAQLEKPIKT